MFSSYFLTSFSLVWRRLCLFESVEAAKCRAETESLAEDLKFKTVARIFTMKSHLFYKKLTTNNNEDSLKKQKIEIYKAKETTK